MRLRPLTIALIACLALADLAGAVWLWVLWQARAAQPPAWSQAATPSSVPLEPSAQTVAAGDVVRVSNCLNGLPGAQGSSGCR